MIGDSAASPSRKRTSLFTAGWRATANDRWIANSSKKRIIKCMGQFKDIYLNRRVLITGRTGFKVSWLSLWLQELGGATVAGIGWHGERHAFSVSTPCGNETDYLSPWTCVRARRRRTMSSTATARRRSRKRKCCRPCRWYLACIMRCYQPGRGSTPPVPSLVTTR